MLNSLLLRELLSKFAAVKQALVEENPFVDAKPTAPAAPAAPAVTPPAPIPNPYHSPKPISPATIPAIPAAQPPAAPQPVAPIASANQGALPVGIRQSPAMDKLQLSLHGGDSRVDPRQSMLDAVQKQSPGGQVAPYQSAVGHALLDRRQLSQNRPLPEEPELKDSAYAYKGKAYVPAKIADRIGVEDRTFYNRLGYNAIANHEMEHANDQPAYFPDWVTQQHSDVSRTESLMDSNRRMLDIFKRPEVPKSLPDNLYSRQLQYHIESQDAYEQAQAAHAAATKTYEDSGAKGVVDRSKYRELGPTIGDLVFRSEQFAKEHGKPLEHTVQFPSGKQHDINWMRQQAQQHGYWDGQSMDSLLMDNTAGQQWLRDAAGSGQMEKQNSAAKADSESVKQSEPQVRVDPKVDAEIGSSMSALGKPVTASRKILFRGSGGGKVMPIPHREATKNYSVRKQSNDTQSLLPVIESLRWRAENSGTAPAVKRADVAKMAATAVIALLRIQ